MRERRRKRVVSVEVLGDRMVRVWGWCFNWVVMDYGRVDVNGNLDVEIRL